MNRRAISLPTLLTLTSLGLALGPSGCSSEGNGNPADVGPNSGADAASLSQPDAAAPAVNCQQDCVAKASSCGADQPTAQSQCSSQVCNHNLTQAQLDCFKAASCSALIADPTGGCYGSACSAGDKRCNGLDIETCQGGQWSFSQSCSVSCLNGACVSSPHPDAGTLAGLDAGPTTCAGSTCGSDDGCCASYPYCTPWSAICMPSCKSNDTSCFLDDECCGALCDRVSNNCTTCHAAGTTCAGNGECCNGTCSGGSCDTCKGPSEICTVNADCCSNICKLAKTNGVTQRLCWAK